MNEERWSSSDCAEGSGRERERLPAIATASTNTQPSAAAPAGAERGPKVQFPAFNSFISTINPKQETIGAISSVTQPVLHNAKYVRELPPINPDVRQKQRISIEILPPEMKAPFPPDPVLPIRTKTVKEFQEDIEKAKTSGDWKIVHDFYSTTFDSFLELNAAFKPQDIQKAVLKGIINSLLKEWKGPRTKDDLRAYFLLVQNPQFAGTSTYIIYAHLLRQMATLSEADHHFLVHWFQKMPLRRFKQLVERLLQFVSLRLFPAKPDDLPPLAKCTWWISSATKVLALLNAANSLANPPSIPFMDFYNSTLDHIDLMEEYRIWQCCGNSHRSFGTCTSN